MKSGIYKIENKNNGKVYIGQSIDILKRWRYHINRLSKNSHPNSHLQNAWNKYGEESFEFEILEECNNQDLCKRENFWCNKFESFFSTNGYNLTITSDFKKYNLTEEGRKKIGDKHRGKSISQETRLLISSRLKGKKRSEETKKKMSKPKTPWTKEMKENQSILKKGKGPTMTELWIKSKLKRIVSINKDGIEISYNSIKEASEILKIKPTNIVACCKGRKKSSKGLIFKYQK